MKKALTLSFACLLALDVLGQDVNEINRMSNIDWKEDTTEIVTIDDILKTQREITMRNSWDAHNRDVWSRKTFLNLSYNNTTLKPDGFVPNGLDGKNVPEFKTDWGVSLKAGHSYGLHKKPIANMVQFNIDYTYVDLNVNHFKADDKNGQFLYNSSKKPEDKKYYTPWLLEKYEFNYGMALGPSLLVAPFTRTNLRGLHYVNLHFFYHIGYHVSVLNMVSNEDADANNSSIDKADFEKIKDNVKLDIGHGLMMSYGASLSWKFIGVGYEFRTASAEFQPLSSDFDSTKYKFKSSTNRVYLQFRM